MPCQPLRPFLAAAMLVAVVASGPVAHAQARAPAVDFELKKVGKIEMSGRYHPIAECSPDGQSVAAACDGVCRIYDAGTLKPLTPELVHGQRITDVQFDPGGERVLTVSEDYARVWNARTGRRLSPRLRHGKNTKVTTAALSPDGRRLLTVAAEPPLPPGITAALIDPQVSDEEGEVRVWDVQTGEMVFALPHPSFVQCAVFSPDGSRIVTASTSLAGNAYLWDAADGTQVGGPIRDAITGSPIAAFSADGKRFVVNCWYKVQVHAADTGKHIRTIAECAPHSLPTSVALSPDGKVVYMCDQSTAPRSWSVETGKQIAGPMTELGYFEGASFSSDGKWILSPGDEYLSAGLWDCQTGKAVWTAPDNVENIASAVFQPDGSVSLVSAGYVGIFVYRLERAK